MRILFLHPNFPAQFRDLAAVLARQKGNEVVYLTTGGAGELPGVRKVLYQPARPPHEKTHHYVRPLEGAVLQGQAIVRACQDLKKSGFVPDVVYGHSGWGPTLFVRDIFPRAALLCLFEWFYSAYNADADFDPAEPLTLDDQARIRVKNAPILLDLVSCTAGNSPMHFQKAQFPAEFRNKLTVLHEGIDTTFFAPNPGASLVLPNAGLDLTGAAEIVTYVGRGMDPYRGFPQFIEALDRLLADRPQCHAVIVGQDRIAYGRPPKEGGTWKEAMLRRFPLDPARVHFTGPLPYVDYLKVLQSSSVHVYLTRPFVLSWSMLEAMSAECLLVASDTPSVTEVVEDGFNGLLVDFLDPAAIAGRIAHALDHRDALAPLRQKARQTIEHRYSTREILPRRVAWVKQFA